MIGSRIEPKRVIYEYDGPVIFIATLGVIDFLFYKAAEDDETDTFIASETGDHVLDVMLAGRLSVLGALRSERVFIFKCTADLRITFFQKVDFQQIDPKILPRKTTPIFSHFAPAVDYYEQATSFFSVRFEGKSLKKHSIPFSRFKQLIDETYDATRRLFSPAGLGQARSPLFDYPLFEPAFSSLIISVGPPTFNLSKISKKLGDDLNAQELTAQFKGRQQSFFDELTNIVQVAEARKLKADDIDEHYYVIDSVRSILPTEDNDLSSVEFVAADAGNPRKLKVSERVGGAIEGAYKEISRTKVTRRGTVDIINNTSHSFVMIPSQGGKKITCYASWDDFDKLLVNPRFRPKAMISATGRFEKRAQRDLLILTESPTLE
ncbi:hypothetical protein AMST5_00973 [freshwater sediment metagenome]|uniref:Uncharacterized protein n=1 Tax=freshwater sediment metagenome TaxID=556182 RepID=A0AA48RC82_9ZZZZ